ncbi:histidine--tRNA ligase [bacterium SCSIO 12741]|nr:histidine--tRNA ligase [bacterium SCSIO 12741]
MAKQRLNTPKGTRDFLPLQASRRNYLFDTIRSVFHTYGFAPIETPAMELTETLMGKYGEEGDRLIFKIMPRGEKLKNAGSDIRSEEALRYDLTVPFARMVAQHRNELSFPFKRYQIQPVWRADRPQAGRYREFYQCDIDMIGSESLLNEVELIQVINEVFSRLKLPEVTIKLNNRKILQGIADILGQSDNMMTITIALDKLDKVGREGVEKELREKGIPDEAIQKLETVFNLPQDGAEALDALNDLFADSEMGQKGVEELRFLIDYVQNLDLKGVQFDATLARGLNYYTGAIFEVTHPDFNSSICGGGRYDNLTGIFDPKLVLSGVGVSFGADRIYDLLLKKELFPADLDSTTDVLFVNFGEAEAAQCMKWATELRQAGIRTEIYPDSAKMRKQMKYANDKQVPYVVLVGEQEMENGLLTVKDMKAGTQDSVSVQDLIARLQSK